MSVLKAPARTPKEQAIFSTSGKDITVLERSLARREEVANEELIALCRENPTQGAIARILAEVLADRDNQWIEANR